MSNLKALRPQLLKHSPQSARNEIETPHFIVGIDPKSGAIHRLRNKKSKREWASSEHPLALFSYQTLSQQDYSRFFESYVVATKIGPEGLRKPIERFGAESREWLPSASDVWVQAITKVIACWHIEINDSESLRSGQAAFPQKMYLEMLLPKAEPVIHLNFPGSEAPHVSRGSLAELPSDCPGSQGWMLENQVSRYLPGRGPVRQSPYARRIERLRLQG